MCLVKRINRAWIVRHGLADSAGQYLEHLEGLQDRRYELTVRIVTKVLGKAQCDEYWKDKDPKAYFYPALFCLSGSQEREVFLAQHAFTNSILSALAEVGCAYRLSVSVQTQEKIEAVVTLIRSVVREMPEFAGACNSRILPATL